MNTLSEQNLLIGRGLTVQWKAIGVGGYGRGSSFLIWCTL